MILREPDRAWMVRDVHEPQRSLKLFHVAEKSQSLRGTPDKPLLFRTESVRNELPNGTLIIEEGKCPVACLGKLTRSLDTCLQDGSFSEA